MIEKFEIIKYKCFDDFTLEGLSRINIISGKNNVGKTALLEAFYITSDISGLKFLGGNLLLYPLSNTIKNRGVTDQTFKYSLSSVQYNVVINNKDYISFKYKSSYNLSDKEKHKLKKFNQDYSNFLTTTINNTLELIPLDEVKFNDYNTYNTVYINSSKPTNNKLVKLYSQIQTKGLQHKFLKYLQILDKDIVWIEPQAIEEEMFLRINLENPEHSLLSSELGEGTNRFIQILAVILTNKDGMVFIDEIENGLHYSRLYNIWKAIIEIVRSESVQLFVTTHDKESMEALHKASVDSEFDEVTSIELYKDESNKIVPIVMDYENFSLGLEMGEDFRG